MFATDGVLVLRNLKRHASMLATPSICDRGAKSLSCSLINLMNGTGEHAALSKRPTSEFGD